MPYIPTLSLVLEERLVYLLPKVALGFLSFVLLVVAVVHFVRFLVLVALRLVVVPELLVLLRLVGGRSD
jgi:hypothetical protein